MNLIKMLLRDQFRMLAFLPIKPDMKRYGIAYFLMGLIFTWLAGVGRYWDHPRPEMWQTLGLGSVGYIFVLAFIIWLVFLPLRPGKHWSYMQVLIFVSMTSLPAILYAIPVERMMPMSSAQQVNLWFLLVVALWRVVLLLVFLKRTTVLNRVAIIVGAFLPLTVIVITLTVLNMDHVIIQIMAGLHEKAPEPTGGEKAYGAMGMMSGISFMSFPVLLTYYLQQIKKNKLNDYKSHEDAIA